MDKKQVKEAAITAFLFVAETTVAGSKRVAAAADLTAQLAATRLELYRITRERDQLRHRVHKARAAYCVVISAEEAILGRMDRSEYTFAQGAVRGTFEQIRKSLLPVVGVPPTSPAEIFRG